MMCWCRVVHSDVVMDGGCVVVVTVMDWAVVVIVVGVSMCVISMAIIVRITVVTIIVGITMVTTIVSIMVRHGLEVLNVLIMVLRIVVLMISNSALNEGDIVVLNTVLSSCFKFMEELIILVLDLSHKLVTIVVVDIMVVVGILKLMKIATIVTVSELTMVGITVMGITMVVITVVLAVVIIMIDRSDMLTVPVVSMVPLIVSVMVDSRYVVAAELRGNILTVVGISVAGPSVVLRETEAISVRSNPMVIMVSDLLEVMDVLIVVVWVVDVVVGQSSLNELNVVVLNTMLGAVLKLVEKLIVLMLNLSHKSVAIVVVDVVVVVGVSLNVMSMVIVKIVCMRLFGNNIVTVGVVRSHPVVVERSSNRSVRGIGMISVVSVSIVISVMAIDMSSSVAVVISRVVTSMRDGKVSLLVLVGKLIRSHLFSELVTSSKVSLGATLGWSGTFGLRSSRLLVLMVIRIMVVLRVIVARLREAWGMERIGVISITILVVSRVGTVRLAIHGRRNSVTGVSSVAIVVSTAHLTMVLSSVDIVMVIFLCTFLAICMGSWLSLHWLDGGKLVSVDTVDLIETVRLHSENKSTILDERLRSAESGGVGIKGSVVTLVPAVSVESVELIAPVEIETLGSGIVSVGFDVVVVDLPRHVLGIKAFAPRFESWGPEVHHDTLRLRGKLNRGIRLSDAANLLVVNGPSNEFRSPRNLINVPLILRVEARLIVMRLTLVLTISIDHIHGEWVLSNRRDDLDVELVPAARVEVGTVPIGEEGSNCALLVGRLHPGNELAVSELLEASHSTRLELRSCSNRGDKSECEFHWF